MRRFVWGLVYYLCDLVSKFWCFVSTVPFFLNLDLGFTLLLSYCFLLSVGNRVSVGIKRVTSVDWYHAEVIERNRLIDRYEKRELALVLPTLPVFDNTIFLLAPHFLV